MKLAGLKTAENAHDDSIWAAAWIPARENRPALLLTGSLDETVRLWHTDELSPAAPPSEGHALGVVSVAAHPGGVVAASASLDSFIRVFDVESNNSIATLEAPPSEVWNMQFDPKRAPYQMETGTGKEKSYVHWTVEMDRTLSSVLLEEHGNGHKTLNGWKAVAFTAAIKGMKDLHNIDFTKEKIMARLKTWNKYYKEVSAMLDTSGFGWD